MKRVNLTPFHIQSVKPPQKGRKEIWDAKVPGLALRVTDKDARSWIYMGRLYGKQIRLTLGPADALSLADARTKALEAYQLMVTGDDPRIIWGRQKETKKQAVWAKPVTFAECYEDYVRRYAEPTLKSFPVIDRVMRCHVLPVLGKLPAEQITKGQFMRITDMLVAKGHGTMANRVLAYSRAFLNWCVERELIAASPIASMKAPAKEQSRARYLSDDEIIAVWSAGEEMGWPFGYYVKFMMLTGQRREETAAMKWQHIDVEAREWYLPAENTKNGHAHCVYLSEQALQLLQSLPVMGEYVFTTMGDRPISGYSKYKKRCDAIAGVTDWWLHDLRRTMATNLARLGVPLEVTEKMLNHISGRISGLVATYNRHEYEDKCRAAFEQYSHFIHQLVNSDETDRVIPLRQNCA